MDKLTFNSFLSQNDLHDLYTVIFGQPCNVNESLVVRDCWLKGKHQTRRRPSPMKISWRWNKCTKHRGRLEHRQTEKLKQSDVRLFRITSNCEAV